MPKDKPLCTASEQPLPLLLAAALFGILLDRFAALSPALWFLLLTTLLVLWQITRRKEKTFLSTLFLSAALFALCGLEHHYRWFCFAENNIGNYASKTGAPANIQGTVIEMPRYLPRPPQDAGSFLPVSERTFFTLKAAHIRDGTGRRAVSGKVSVCVDGDVRHFRIGDVLELSGQLSKPVEAQNPDDYDYAAVLRSYRILCNLRCSSADKITLLKTGPFSMSRILESVRRAGAERLRKGMTAENADAATAMLLGIREGVDDETTESLIATGTMHIISISGLHVGLIAAFTVFVLWLCGVSRRTAGIALICTVTAYLFLTDVRAPAIRSTIMISVIAAALFSKRTSLSINTFTAAALCVLLLNPAELFQFGTQLSFLATAGFFWIPPLKINTTDTKKRFLTRVLRNTLKLFLTGIVIWLLTMPLLLTRIHLFTPVAVLVNPLLWLPLTAAMVSGFAAMIAGAVPYIGSVFGCAADISFSVLFGMIAFFQRLGGYYWVPAPPLWWNIGFYSVFSVLTFLPPEKIPRRYLCYALFIWLAAGFVSFPVSRFVRYYKDELTFSVLSVGHGNCSFIITPQNNALVYDAGCISSPRRAADVMSNALWRFGKTSIETVILSHPDNDHINGIFLLAERFRIKRILVSPYFFEPLYQMNEVLRKKNLTAEQLNEDEFQDGKILLLFQQMVKKRKIPLIEIGAGDNLGQYGLPKTAVHHPPKQGFSEFQSSNAASLVIRFEHHQTGVLLTGDLNCQQRCPFLEHVPVPCGILMIPHHGGKSNQTDALLQWTKPKVLIISAGRFTHRDSAVEHFRKNGYEVRSTFLEGAVTLRF
ncbi:MAG: ComEC/Rec2 family competence protein [Planctomycetaceae bacterium]|jgi:competence protein ComEC|nr:ComEC/Rec2 family competence protein [Planctomycetaceae bacterium]